MAQSRKRRSSMSPVRGQPSPDTPEHKKRKPNGISSNINGASSSSKPATPNRLPVARTPAPLGSDSSTTLDGDTPPSKDKGKAVEKDPLILELERLRKEVAHKNEILEKRERAITAVTQTLTCQICLELMHKPYALAPCGHVSCHGCLVSWFTSPHNDHEGDEHNPDVEWFSDDGSSVDEHDAHIPWPGIGDLANGNEPGNNPNPVNGNVDGNAVPLANGGPAPPADDGPALPPPPGPAHAPYPSAVLRKKTCPHCRCVVKERPVQVYAIKDLVGIVDLLSTEPAKNEDVEVDKEGGEDKDQEEGGEKNDKKEGSVKDKKAKDKDPWKGIFRPPKPPGPGHGAGHNLNDDDNDDHPGGWPGLGLGGQNVAQFFLDDGEDEEVILPLPNLHNILFAHHQHNHALPHPPVDVDADPALPPPFIDEEDGVRRCGRCMHELWGGECSNEECGAVYGGPSENSDVGEAVPNYGGLNHAHAHDHDHDHDDEGSDSDAVVDWGFREPGFGHMDGDDDDDGYESSFIDDDERRKRGRSVQGSEDTGTVGQDPDELLEDPEDDFIPGPSRRWVRARQEAIIISSDEDADEDAPGPSTRVRRGRRQIMDEDEDEEEHEVEERVGSIDEGILALDPYHVMHLRGPGSSAGNSLLGSASEAPSLDHGTNIAEDEDDEYDGHVPYVWEEDGDSDDVDHEQDHIMYLHGGDRSADGSADEGDPGYAYDG